MFWLSTSPPIQCIIAEPSTSSSTFILFVNRLLLGVYATRPYLPTVCGYHDQGPSYSVL
jgi:hypothetical protein